MDESVTGSEYDVTSERSSELPIARPFHLALVALACVCVCVCVSVRVSELRTGPQFGKLASERAKEL